MRADVPTPAPTFQVPPRRHEPTPFTHQQKEAEVLDSSFVGMSGGQIFHEMMLRHNVKHIFGYPGGAIPASFRRYL